MTPELALGIGRAAGTLYNGAIAVGRDTRTSSDLLANSMISALACTGRAVVDVGILPTPALQYHVKTRKLGGGVMITASHNPPEFNGIKCIDSLGMEASVEDEEAIEAIYFEKRHEITTWEHIGHIQQVRDAVPRYVESILAKVDKDAILKRKPKVALDCGNGAACFTSPYLTTRLGCSLVTLNAQPDGHFPGRLPEPTAANVSGLMRVVKETGADIGIAHDGDADRAIFVDEKGQYIFGDKSLALLAGEELAGKGGVVVTPISSSSCIEDVVKMHGGEVHYTRVGSPIVARKMYELGATFGGEENGGMIFPGHQFCRDGGMALAKMLELLAHHHEPLSELIAQLPQYQLFKTSIPYPAGLRDQIMEGVAARASDAKVIAIDGVKILHDDGWILVRPSGTEPIFRVYAESKSKTRAEELGKEGVATVEEVIRKLGDQASHRSSE